MNARTCTNTTERAYERAQALAADILAKREEALASEIKPKPRRSIHASQIPECARQGVYEFTHWDQKKLWGPDVQALMNAGKVQEEAYKKELRALGYQLVEDSSSIGQDMFDRYGIHGYLDTKIEWAGTRIPIEMKAVRENIYDRIESVDDMRQYAYMRKYIRQGLVYLLGTNQEAMLFAFTNSRGGWKFIPLALDLAEAEGVLKMAEQIKKHVEAKTLPERIHYNHEICGKCAFQHVCLPDIQNDPTVKFMDNPEVVKDLDRLDEISPAASEYDKLWKKVKEIFDGVQTAVVGNWVVTGKTITMKGGKTQKRLTVEKRGQNGGAE